MGDSEILDISMTGVIERVITVVLVSVIIGGGSAYVSAKITIASVQEKISHNEGRIEQISDFNTRLRKDRRELIDRLARIEENQQFIKEQLSKNYE